jgi:hypothetical protein
MLEKLFGPQISLDDYCLVAGIPQANCNRFRDWLALTKLDGKLMTATSWGRYHSQYLALLGGLAGDFDSERS